MNTGRAATSPQSPVTPGARVSEGALPFLNASVRPGTALMARKQAAAYLNVSPWTLARWEARGVGPDYVAYPNNRRRYYAREALDAFIAQHTRCRLAAGRTAR